MAGAQATLEATGMQSRRMTDQEMFLEIKRALNPLTSDTRPYKQGLALRERPRPNRQCQH